MLKVFSLIKRRDDMSLDEFRDWILNEHAPKGRELPGLGQYHAVSYTHLTLPTILRV